MRRLSWWLTGLIVVLVGLFLLGSRLAAPPVPEPWYGGAPDPTLAPGRLLDQRGFDRGVPPDSTGWRIRYRTTAMDGRPAVASALVMAANTAVDGPRPVILWTHGTTGVATGCAPSLLAAPFANVPALPELLAAGWIFVAPDYVGLGTAGPHPYLIGEGAARAALDAVRAAKAMASLELGENIVVWGHSQGGHAALWTAIRAPDDAPELRIAGVAAIAPATDLPALMDAIHRTPIGRILGAFVLRSYSEIYPDVNFDDYSSGLRGWLARDIASRCLEGRGGLWAAALAVAGRTSLFDQLPTAGPLGARLAENVPAGPVAAPLLIAQGLEDPVVVPEIQSRFVEARCREGQAIEFRTYPGLDHLAIVGPGSPLTDALVEWTARRFDGESWSGNCVTPGVDAPAAEAAEPAGAAH